MWIDITRISIIRKQKNAKKVLINDFSDGKVIFYFDSCLEKNRPVTGVVY